MSTSRSRIKLHSCETSVVLWLLPSGVSYLRFRTVLTVRGDFSFKGQIPRRVMTSRSILGLLWRYIFTWDILYKILVVINFSYFYGICSTANVFLVWLVLVAQRCTRIYETWKALHVKLWFWNMTVDSRYVFSSRELLQTW